MTDVSPPFRPFTLRAMELKNRIVMAHVVQRIEQYMYGLAIQILIMCFSVEAFQYARCCGNRNIAPLNPEVIAPRMDSHIQTLLDQLEVLVKRPREGAQATGIVGL